MRRLREDRPDLSANMHIDIISLFPNIASAPLGESMIGKAQERGLITIRSHNLRDWATDKHRTTDDTPYGGSQGMVLKCEPLFAAVEQLRGADPESRSPNCQVLLMSPAGRPFTQRVAEELSLVPHVILICGHYEGVDQRVIDHLIDGELSIGDYVLTNGALAAAVVTDAIARLLPGVLGDTQSAPDDSHSNGLLEFPQYTRPVEFRGWRVPDVLLSGHHAEIAKWRRARAVEKTERVRPDMLGKSEFRNPKPSEARCIRDMGQSETNSK
jgi:tRNA (guanine37-N1)-methyltransferase